MHELEKQELGDDFRRAIAQWCVPIAEQQRFNGDHRAIDPIGAFVPLTVDFDLNTTSDRRALDTLVSRHN